MKALLKYLLISIFCIGISTPSLAQHGEILFQQGMMKEEGEGKLKEAIDIYYQLVEDESIERKIRAKALFQVGICYEKLGVKKATSAYEQLISEYADQTDLIAVAKRKLRSIKGQVKPVSLGLASQRIQKNLMSPRILHEVSPDGRYFSFYESTPYHKNDNTIVVHDLMTDKMTSVSEWIRGNASGKKGSKAWSSSWSPDGKKLAYSYRNNEQDNVTKHEIYLVDADGNGKEVIYSNVKSKGLEVYDFSSDGKKVLFALSPTNGENALMEVNIASGKTQIIKVADPGFFAHGFRYSPIGPYIAYTQKDDIYTLNSESGQIEQVTFFDGADFSPVWSLKGDKLLFISDRQGSSDLFYVDMIQGKTSGTPITLKRHLGEGALIMGLDKTGAIYFKANSARTDIYTLDFSSQMDILPSSIKQITTPRSDNSNGFASYSNDGKYISYQGKLVKMADGLRSDVNSKYNGYDDELGYKYSINIYNSETNESKLLDIPLYLNHYPRSQAWMVPTWSYHGNQLLVHGRIRKDFTGGFFIVDVEKETITPALTKPNCKVGMTWNEMEMGNSMFFSRKKDIIYYSTPGWEKAMKYNIITGESKELASIEGGFWFDGFNDIEETKLRGRKSSLGDFEYDVNTGQIKKLAEAKFGKSRQVFDNKTVGFTMHDLEGNLVFRDVTSQEKFKKVLRLVMDSGESKEFNLNELFPECLIRLEDFQPEKNQLLLSVIKNPGNEIYKISNLFE